MIVYDLGDIYDNFIEEYVKYASEICDAPTEYHIANAMFMISAVTLRKVYLETSYMRLYPNIWVLLLGKSGISRKTVSMNIALDILREVLPDNELPSDVTPEQLIVELESLPVGYMIRDEMSGFFDMLNRDYMSGIKDTLMKVYDCIDKYGRSTRKYTVNIKDVYVSILGATTPSRLFETVSACDFEVGFLSRFMLITYRDRTYKGVINRRPEHDEIRKKLINTLRFIKDLCSIGICMYMDNYTLGEFNKWKNELDRKIEETTDDALVSVYARIPETVLKVAMIMRLSRPIELLYDIIKNIKYKGLTQDKANEAMLDKLIEVYGKPPVNGGLPEKTDKAHRIFQGVANPLAEEHEIGSSEKDGAEPEEQNQEGTTQNSQKRGVSSLSSENKKKGIMISCEFVKTIIEKNKSQSSVRERGERVHIEFTEIVASKLYTDSIYGYLANTFLFFYNKELSKLIALMNSLKARYPNGQIPHSDLLKYSHMRSDQFNQCIRTLVESGVVSCGYGNRKSKYYVLSEIATEVSK